MGTLDRVWLSYFIFSNVIDCVLSEYCRERYYSTYYHDYRYREIHCTWGCCGNDHYDEYCCVSNAGIIVGIVFAGIFGIAIISAAVCCIIKHKGSRGRVIRPTGGGTTTTVVETNASGNVFIVPTGPAPPPYTAAMYTNPGYGPYPVGPSAPMPPAYSATGDPTAYNTIYPPAYSTVQAAPNPFQQNASAAAMAK